MLRLMGVIAPPPSAGLPRRIGGIAARDPRDRGPAARARLGHRHSSSRCRSAALDPTLSIFWGFLLVAVVIGVLAFFGRRRQNAGAGEGGRAASQRRGQRPGRAPLEVARRAPRPAVETTRSDGWPVGTRLGGRGGRAGAGARPGHGAAACGRTGGSGAEAGRSGSFGSSCPSSAPPPSLRSARRGASDWSTVAAAAALARPGRRLRLDRAPRAASPTRSCGCW